MICTDISFRRNIQAAATVCMPFRKAPCILPFARLAEKSMITDRQEKAGKRRVRAYYHLVETGKEYLISLLKEYCAICWGRLSIWGIREIKNLEEEL